MIEGKFVGYVRVSTAKQGRSGLGLEAQRKTIDDYLNGGAWSLLAEYVEVESGKSEERPQLHQALDHCRMTGATLLIAKLDRLSRDLHFITLMQKSSIRFVACDMPEANEFTINVMGALAQQERKMISQRTRDALSAAKTKGVRLGSPQNLDKKSAAKGRIVGLTTRIRQADKFAEQLFPTIQRFQEQGASLRRIANKLNEASILTARGKVGSWTAAGVKNVISRMDAVHSIPS
jgi:DNA invertase Pin-like site-specific DNA recombinase